MSEILVAVVHCLRDASAKLTMIATGVCAGVLLARWMIGA